MRQGMTFATSSLKESMAFGEETTMSETASKAGRRRSRFRNFVLILLALAVIGVSSPARARADYSVVQCVPNSVSYTDAGAFAFGAYSIWAQP